MFVVQRGAGEVHGEHDGAALPGARVMNQPADEFRDDTPIKQGTQAVLDGGLQHRMRRGVRCVFGSGAQQYFVALHLAALAQRHQTLHMQRNGVLAYRGV